MSEYAEILGVRFPKITEKDLIKTIFSLDKATIFTPNPEIALYAHKDSSFASILNSASLLLPDGTGIILASKILGTPLTERICGIDAGELILEEASRRGLKLFLLGGSEENVRGAAEKLSEKYTDLKICGYHHGYFEKEGEENEKIIDIIKEKRPDILFVCFGAPMQEIWISKNAEKLPSLKICIGLGGSIDVWSGKVARAPLLFRQLGIEWIWRTIREPRRIKRLYKLPLFLIAVLKERALRKAKKINLYK